MGTTGVVIGKFLPPHKGHSALIEFAESRVDRLFVIVCDGPRYSIPGALRTQWLRQLHPRAEVILVDEQHADDDSAGWAKRTKQVIGAAPTHVFTSEKYGDAYAKHLGCRHILFDLERTAMPISGTKVRQDPWASADFLAPIVRAYFVKRVAIVGAESSGKTTLSNALAASYQTFWVPEYGRLYWEARRHRGDSSWTTDEFFHIAESQNRLEDQYAEKASRVLFCDTNAFLTGIWHRRYLRTYSEDVDLCWRNRRYDAVFFCDSDFPFVQDGTRDGEAIRPEMGRWIRTRLNEEKIPFVELSGPRDKRLAQAKVEVERLLRIQEASP